MDNYTSKSKECGFVDYYEIDHAAKARYEMNSKEFEGCYLRVDYAVDKPRRPRNKPRSSFITWLACRNPKPKAAVKLQSSYADIKLPPSDNDDDENEEDENQSGGIRRLNTNERANEKNLEISITDKETKKIRLTVVISVGALVLYGHDDDDASVKDMSIDKFSSGEQRSDQDEERKMAPTCSNCKRDHATFRDERRKTMAKTKGARISPRAVAKCLCSDEPVRSGLLSTNPAHPYGDPASKRGSCIPEAHSGQPN
ncbi:ABC transporter F family member 4-like protein [Tanacetum coccineum]